MSRGNKQNQKAKQTPGPSPRHAACNLRARGIEAAEADRGGLVWRSAGLGMGHTPAGTAPNREPALPVPPPPATKAAAVARNA